MRRKWLVITLAPVAFAAFVALGGEIVMLLWNWLLPELFGLPRITFWQGLGLLALCRILFGGLGGRGLGRSAHRMTPEQREKIRQEIRARACNRGPAAGGPETA